MAKLLVNRRPQSVLQTAATVVLIISYLAGVNLGGPIATMAACVAIVLIGLPHGTLDIELIKHERATHRHGLMVVLLTYLGLALAMYGAWRVAPIAALATFLIVAVIHFAEDWDELGSAFLAQGMAIALLTAPTLLHLVELENLFVALTGHGDARVVSSVMLLLAPVSLAVASVAVVALWRDGHRHSALIATSVLVGMVVLPPVIGFAAFFCLYHSPRHLGSALARVARSTHARRIIPLLTFAALGITAALFALETRADVPAQVVAASFMILSLLTVPHMLVPTIVAAFHHRAASGRRRPDQAQLHSAKGF